jgi:hypothetical protein
MTEKPRISKFIFSQGKHEYHEIPKNIFDHLNESTAEHKFVSIKNHHFEYVGMMEQVIPVFKEVEVLDLKIANFYNKLAKLGNTLFEDKYPSIEQYVAEIGVPNDSRKLKRIIEIKDSHRELYGKDLAEVNVLWWEAKLESFQNRRRLIDPKHSKFLQQVQKELQNKLTNALQQYHSFPETR